MAIEIPGSVEDYYKEVELPDGNIRYTANIRNGINTDRCGKGRGGGIHLLLNIRLLSHSFLFVSYQMAIH